MKITENINLGGLIFTIDQDAFFRLQSYLETVGRYFGQKDESEEIQSDIESRIAEHFQSQLGKNKEVVTLADVEKAIEILGMPQDFGTNTTQKNVSQSRNNYQPYRRLFRDPDNSVLGGVCSGFGFYFNLDPVIVRVIFILLGLFAGGIILYLVLWIVLPAALSMEDKQTMKAYGQYSPQRSSKF
jgi:phage shock protein PspC (stress-responsive transcriptional regulator)